MEPLYPGRYTEQPMLGCVPDADARCGNEQDQSGNDRYSTEIILQGFSSTLTMLDGGKAENGASSQGEARAHQQSESDSYGNAPTDSYDDDIPF